MAFESISIQPALADVQFVGLAFYISLVFLWVFVQGFIWLSVRYSRLISTTQLWKSAAVAFISSLLMVIGWNLPQIITQSEQLMLSLTSAIACGAITTWVLCGYLYNFELIHRTIVALAVPLLHFCTIAIGLVLHSKIIR